jgi:hypothetical protein
MTKPVSTPTIKRFNDAEVAANKSSLHDARLYSSSFSSSATTAAAAAAPVSMLDRDLPLAASSEPTASSPLASIVPQSSDSKDLASAAIVAKAETGRLEDPINKIMAKSFPKLFGKSSEFRPLPSSSRREKPFPLNVEREKERQRVEEIEKFFRESSDSVFSGWLRRATDGQPLASLLAQHADALPIDRALLGIQRIRETLSAEAKEKLHENGDFQKLYERAFRPITKKSLSSATEFTNLILEHSDRMGPVAAHELVLNCFRIFPDSTTNELVDQFKPVRAIATDPIFKKAYERIDPSRNEEYDFIRQMVRWGVEDREFIAKVASSYSYAINDLRNDAISEGNKAFVEGLSRLFGLKSEASAADPTARRPRRDRSLSPPRRK